MIAFFLLLSNLLCNYSYYFDRLPGLLLNFRMHMVHCSVWNIVSSASVPVLMKKVNIANIVMIKYSYLADTHQFLISTQQLILSFSYVVKSICTSSSTFSELPHLPLHYLLSSVSVLSYLPHLC